MVAQFHAMCGRTIRRALAIASLLLMPVHAMGYATGDGAGGLLSHQWITRQGWLYYRSQFGPSEIDDFLGPVAQFPVVANSTVMEGVFAEDEAARNPWGHGAIVGALNHPSLRHFWTPSPAYARLHWDGLHVFIPPTLIPPQPGTTIVFDSAPNRAIKYFTGGLDIIGAADPQWGGGEGALPNVGIAHHYNLGAKAFAYYWLGHVAHLLQDMTLPAHSQGDQHLEVFGGVGVNPDPVHDWVDGVDFSTGLLVNPARRAAFDDINAARYTRWRFSEAHGGVARVDGAQVFGLIDADIRSPSDMLSPFANPSLNLPEVAASIPVATLNAIRPLFYQFLEAASISDNFDSRNSVGQVDNSTRGDHSIFDINNYDNWTREELDGVADIVVPHAMRATAELFRYFYAIVDPTPPMLEVSNLSGNPNNPTVFGVLPNDIPAVVRIQYRGADDVSGVDLDSFYVSIHKFVDDIMDWVPLTSWAPDAPGLAGFINVPGLEPGQYRAFMTAENGAGLTGHSPNAYFSLNVIPAPPSAALLLLAICGKRRRKRDRGCKFHTSR